MTTEKLEEATILIVDDDPTNVRVLNEHLREAGFKTLIARNGEAALRQTEYARPDLILLDVMMPGIDGFETCRRLKNNEPTKDIPVIFLTALSDPVNKVKGIEAGGVDYITKPFEGLELLARVKAHLELSRYREKLKYTNQELQQANEALLKTREKLELAARTDPLTQLSNRRDLMEKIKYEKIRFERSQKPFSLALCDVDNFKYFNDIHGHDCGDFVLVSIARLIRSLVRKQDHLGRWGGEEFLFVFPETGLEGARVASEKIREKIANQSFIHKDISLSITLTFGVYVFDDYTMPIDECIKKADQALYTGKQQGKDRVVLYETG